MDNIKVTAGIKQLSIVDINGDQKCVVEFNPTDILFVDRFYEIYREFENKQAEYDKRSLELDAQSDQLDENDIPLNMQAGLDFVKEVCDFMREKIDYLFGEGTSQKVFGDVQSVDMIEQFLQGVTPYIQEARTKKVNKYTNSRTAKKNKTMK